jgi:hypothetical protein
MSGPISDEIIQVVSFVDDDGDNFSVVEVGDDASFVALDGEPSQVEANDLDFVVLPDDVTDFVDFGDDAEFVELDGGSGSSGGSGGGSGGHTILDLDGVSYPQRGRLQFPDGFTVSDHEPTDLTAVELRLGLGLAIVDHSLTIDTTYFDLGIATDASHGAFVATDGAHFLMTGGDPPPADTGTGSITDPQPAHTFLGGPVSGPDALPIFRPVDKDDLPSLYEWEQMAAVNVLVLVHNLDCFPTVLLRDTVGNTAVPDVVYNSRNQLTITTTALWSGVATLGR